MHINPEYNIRSKHMNIVNIAQQANILHTFGVQVGLSVEGFEFRGAPESHERLAMEMKVSGLEDWGFRLRPIFPRGVVLLMHIYAERVALEGAFCGVPAC